MKIFLLLVLDFEDLWCMRTFCAIDTYCYFSKYSNKNYGNMDLHLSTLSFKFFCSKVVCLKSSHFFKPIARDTHENLFLYLLLRSMHNLKQFINDKSHFLTSFSLNVLASILKSQLAPNFHPDIEVKSHLLTT